MRTFICASSTISTISWRIQILWVILFYFIYSTTSLTINSILSTLIITVITHQFLWFLNTIFFSFNFFIDFIKLWVSFWKICRMVILVNHFISWGLTLFFKRTSVGRCFACTAFLLFIWHVISEFFTTKMDICIWKIHALVVLIRESDLLNHWAFNFS